MGYSTDFSGGFSLDKPLDDDTYTFLVKFNDTRRMARKVDPKYGTEGEFFVGGTGHAGQDDDPSIIDYERPPRTQPGLWCQWVPSEDRKHICWDGGEKFYYYVEWIKYLIDRVLGPKGYVLDGEVEWVGEDRDDRGKIVIEHNVTRVLKASLVWEDA